ncbi:MAG: hypothetical protein PVF58_08195 [Candidatus Methanofastidiosia archaeon]
MQGDPTDVGVLEKAGIAHADVVVIMEEVPVSVVKDMAPCCNYCV